MITPEPRISQMRVEFKVAIPVLLIAFALAPVWASPPAPQALAEVQSLSQRFGVPIVQIKAAPGNQTVAASKALTAAGLSGATIDSNPPQFSATPNYPSWQQDGVTTPPYVSSGLQNFGFNYFHNEINFGGWHSWPTVDYSVMHGFDVAAGYWRNRNASWSGSAWINGNWLPAQTLWLSSVSSLDWNSFAGTLGIGGNGVWNDMRWDQAVDVGEAGIIQAIINANVFQGYDPAIVDELMIDLEHYALSPTELQAKSWFPSTGTPAEQAAFQKKYYDGYALTMYATVDAARQLGFHAISLYGWKPIRAAWYDLPGYAGDPASDWYWQSVGIQVIQHVDSVNSSDYCFYWTAANTAYTLAQNDLNLKYVNSLSVSQRKPVRPYYWNQIQGGGGSGWDWQPQQPMATEEMRAISLLGAFTQHDGMVLWSWSDVGNESQPPAVTAAAAVMLKDNSFSALAEADGSLHAFARYDAVYISSVDGSGNVRLQLIDKTNWSNNYGVGATFPYYDTTASALSAHLRAPSEPLAAMSEGLAMAKLLEWNLRNDSIVVDFDPQQTFAQVLPIARHVANGDLHIVATYDPQVIYGQPARNVTINNFGGVAGLNLTFTADSQVRVYILRLK